jgi:hypothetical protein
MKKRAVKFYLIVVMIIFIGLVCGCKPKQPVGTGPERVLYCMSLGLTDGSTVKDTFNLYVNTTFTIEKYGEQYGLRIKKDCLLKLYGYHWVNPGDGFIRFGVSKYTIDNIIHISIKKL